MSPLTFTQALEQAELLARQSLDAALHERLSCATALVRQGSVFQDDAGHWSVASTTTPDKRYSVNGSCSCEDAHFRAPQGKCKHKLAQLLARKVAALMQIAAGPAPDPRTCQEPRSSLSETAGTSSVVDTPTALPEAPASVNVRVQVAGREVQWTLRDTDEARLAERLEALLQRYPPQGPPQAPVSQGKDFCKVHQVMMKEHTNDKGSWFSHFVDGRHCKGK
jgi:hypothetical protein